MRFQTCRYELVKTVTQGASPPCVSHLLPQSPDTTLEEFLEELDALTDAEVEDQKDQESKIELSPSLDFLNTSEEVSAAILREDTSSQGKPEASSPRGSEKKVRFSEELIQGAHTRQNSSPQDSVRSESRSLSSLKASSPKKQKQKVHGPQQPLKSAKQDDHSLQHQEDGSTPVAKQMDSANECTNKDTNPSTDPSAPTPEKACASLQESCEQPVELTKCNISNTNTGRQYIYRLIQRHWRKTWMLFH